MDTKRSINTKIWSDTWFEELTTTDKMIWLYLLTNQSTNMLGIYQLGIRRMAFETGVSILTLRKAFKGFGRVRKGYHILEEYVFLPNWMKNQSFNPNMLKSAQNIYDSLPTDLLLEINKLGFNGFQTLRKGSLMLPKIEIERERENEIESETENKSEIEIETETSWRKDYDIYLEDCSKAYHDFLNDQELMAEQVRLNPGVNVKLSLEKGYRNFWHTEAGWENKKKSRSKTIDWKRTIINSLNSSMNKVYQK